MQLQFSKFKEVPLLASRRTFKKYGQAGLEISDLFPNVARHADDLAVIRSCFHDGFTHTAALNWLNNGWPRLGRPSLGSWVVYGLGSESDSLPAFVVMLEGGIKSGPPVYSSGFLPAMYQGTVLRNGATPILNARPPAGMKAGEQREMLDLLKWNNEKHLAARSDDSDLQARIASYELAFRMQMAAPELTDLSKETAATKACTVWEKRARRSSAANACWRGGWSSAVSASCRCGPAARRAAATGTAMRSATAIT